MSWRCDRCGVVAYFADGRSDRPTGWADGADGLRCLRCRRDAVLDPATAEVDAAGSKAAKPGGSGARPWSLSS